MQYAKNLLILAVLMAMFSPISLQAQREAGIFYFMFTIDKEIVTLEESSNKDGGFFSGMSESVAIPEKLVDSMKRMTERMLSDKLKANVRCIYPKTKGGAIFDTNGMEGGMEKVAVEGLPFSQFKKAEEQFKRDLYVQLIVSIEDGKGVRVDMGGKYSKIKPMISIQAKAFDADKKVVWSEDVEVKNLGKLKRWKEEYDNQVHKGGAVFSAEMIVQVYRIGLEELAAQ